MYAAIAFLLHVLGPIDEFPDKGFEKVMNLNVNAMFALTRDLLAPLEKAGTP